MKALTSPKMIATASSVPHRAGSVPAVLSMPGTMRVATHRLTATTSTRIVIARAFDIGISPPGPG
ncbi:hypothetical protein BJF78_04895 [Pseudonocardia sp. CNS-139]|nr:hypothetical protein BJF78_04895 [Pseudonocardia sp. CNS-139]